MQEQLKVKVGADVSSYNSAMQSMTRTATDTAKRIGIAVAGIFVSSALIGKQFYGELMKTATVAQAYGEDLKRIEEKARELGRTTAFTASQSATAMYDLASAGMKTNEILAATEHSMKLAGATGASMSLATTMIASSLKQFSLAATESARVANTYAGAITNSLLTMDKLREAMKYAGTAGSALNWSIEETTAAVAQFANLGLEGSMAGTQLRMSMVQLTKQTPKATEALEQMGLSFEDINPEAHSFGEILRAVGDQAMTTRQSVALFGSRAGLNIKKLSEAASKGESDFEGFVKMLKESQEGVGRASEMYDRMMSTFSGAWKIMLSALQDLSIEIFNTYKTSVAGVFKNVTELSNTANRALAKYGETVRLVMSLIVEWSKMMVVGGVLYMGLKTAIKMKKILTQATIAYKDSVYAVRAAQLLALKGAQLLIAVFSLLGAALAGVAIGTWMYKESLAVRLYATDMVDGVMIAWLELEKSGKQLWEVLKSYWWGGLASIEGVFGKLIGLAARGAEAFGMKKIAAGLRTVQIQSNATKDTFQANADAALANIKVHEEAYNKKLQAHIITIEAMKDEFLGITALNEQLKKHNETMVKSLEIRAKYQELPAFKRTDEIKAMKARMDELAKIEEEGYGKLGQDFLRENINSEIEAMVKKEEDMAKLREEFGEKQLAFGKSTADQEISMIKAQAAKWTSAFEEGSTERAQVAEWEAKKIKETRYKQLKDGLSDLESNMKEVGKHSKKAFAAYKAVAIANTIISTYESAVAAFKALAGIPFVGPFLGVAAAAAAVAAGMAKVAMIRSQSYTPSYDEGGISTRPGIYYAGVPEAHVPLQSGKIPVSLSGMEKPSQQKEEQPVQVIMNNPVFQDAATQRAVFSQIAETIVRTRAPMVIRENYYADGDMRSLIRGGR